MNHPFAVGDRVVVVKDRRWRFLVKPNKAVFGTVKEVEWRSVLSGWGPGEPVDLIKHTTWESWVCVLRDGGKRAVWWPAANWERADLYRANVFADFLEESGRAEAAALLREKFPISE